MFAHRCTQLSALSLSLCLVLAWAAPAAAQDAPSSLAVTQALIARGVENRLPVNVDVPFLADGERLFVYLEVANTAGPEQEITLHWQRVNGREDFTQVLSVGQSRAWHTWGYHRMGAAAVGQWHVDVMGPEGTLLTSLDFAVEAAPEAPVEAVSQLTP